MAFKRKYKFSIIDHLYYAGRIRRIHNRWSMPLDAIFLWVFAVVPSLLIIRFLYWVIPLWLPSALSVGLCGCSSMKHYGVFQCDNGNDYVSEGLYRIVDKRGRIGYADESGRTVIKPRFAFGFPFENGKAKVTDKGEMKEVPGSDGEYHYWKSDEWYYIDKKGNRSEENRQQ